MHHLIRMEKNLVCIFLSQIAYMKYKIGSH